MMKMYVYRPRDWLKETERKASSSWKPQKQPLLLSGLSQSSVLSLSHSLPLLYSPHWLLLRVRPPAGPGAHFKLKCVRFFWELPHRFFRWSIVYLFYVLLSKRVQSHLLRLFLGYVNLPRSHRWNNATYRMSLCTWATKKRMLMKSSLELHPRVLKTDASS